MIKLSKNMIEIPLPGKDEISESRIECLDCGSMVLSKHVVNDMGNGYCYCIGCMDENPRHEEIECNERLSLGGNQDECENQS